MKQYYRVRLINTETGEKRLTPTLYTSKKKAVEFAEAFEKTMENAKCEVIKK